MCPAVPSIPTDWWRQGNGIADADLQVLTCFAEPVGGHQSHPVLSSFRNSSGDNARLGIKLQPCRQTDSGKLHGPLSGSSDGKQKGMSGPSTKNHGTVDPGSHWGFRRLDIFFPLIGNLFRQLTFFHQQHGVSPVAVSALVADAFYFISHQQSEPLDAFQINIHHFSGITHLHFLALKQ